MSSYDLDANGHQDAPLYYAAGHIVPWSQTVGPAGAMAETLRLHDSAGLFFCPAFTMIVYPTGSESWRFFDERFPVHSPLTALRFFVRTAIPEFSSTNAFTLPSTSSYPIMECETGVNALFRQLYGIEYQKLLPSANKHKSEQPNTFLLIYPPAAQEEYDVTIKFLAANNATVYSWRTPGAWEFFVGNVVAGVVLVSPRSLTPIHCTYASHRFTNHSAQSTLSLHFPASSKGLSTSSPSIFAQPTQVLASPVSFHTVALFSSPTPLSSIIHSLHFAS